MFSLTRKRKGSSPRMRGTRVDCADRSTPVGLIPTYAGNTCLIKLSSGRGWAHPHVCGEHRRLARPVSASAGSSPRMRGTLLIVAAQKYGIGLIPTYAGNTCRRRGRERRSRAHPHVCGEHQSPGGRTLSNGGSSPRMRGTQNTERYAPIHGGLIPTYAGNTSNVPCAVRRGRAHPHVCGEHRQRYFYPASIGGSSPRMRGTPRAQQKPRKA